MEKVPQKILIRGVNWIGDTIMTIPAMRTLRQLFPESRITLLIRKPMDRLFAHFSAVDHVVGFTIRKGMAGLVDRMRLAQKLRREHYDLCLILPNSFDSALILFLAGIPARIGFDRDGRGLLLTRKIKPPVPEEAGHQADDYLSLVTSLGAIQIFREFNLEVDREAKEWAKDQLEPLRQKVSGPLIGLNPGATYGPAKRWFPERFTDLAARLCSGDQSGIVIVGGPEETGLCGNIADGIEGAVLDLSGQTDLQQLAAVLSLCDLLVTNDSGPMHLASAVGTPVVAIFGSTEPGATSPLGKHRIIKEECECSPCLERFCERGDTLCMELIQVEDVYDTVKRLLENGDVL